MEETVAGLLRSAAARHPGRPAVVSAGGEVSTYRELVGRADRLASGLLGLGLRPGDRVAAWLEDGPAYVELYAACALAGLVVVPVSVRATHHEAAHALADSGAAALVFGPGTRERVDGLDADARPPLRATTGTPAAGEHALDALATGGGGTPPNPGPEDLYILGYTSGTTGRPKAAMLTHGSVMAIARLNAISYRLPVGSVAAMTGSMSFVSVVPAHVISHLYVGGTVVFLPGLDPDTVAGSVERYGATFAYAPSPMLLDFAASFEAHPRRWASLTTLLHSASKAPAAHLRTLAAACGGRLVEGWGMTENSGGLVTATVLADAAGPAARLATAGRPVVESWVRLVGGGAPEPDGTTAGELEVRTPALAAGYWNLPGPTAEAFVDGWYRTGDIGTIDPDGYVTIHERRTDLIVSGGINVYPAEVEEVIGRDPRVAECAVVGIPHDRWGQTVAAAVVVVPGAAVTAGDITERCREVLAGYKKPTVVLFVDALPRTHSLKVSRAAVRTLLAAQAGWWSGADEVR